MYEVSFNRPLRNPFSPSRSYVTVSMTPISVPPLTLYLPCLLLSLCLALLPVFGASPLSLSPSLVHCATPFSGTLVSLSKVHSFRRVRGIKGARHAVHGTSVVKLNGDAPVAVIGSSPGNPGRSLYRRKLLLFFEGKYSYVG